MAKGGWTRRRFVGTAAACGVLARAESPRALHGQEALPPPASQKNSPEITAGGLVPLLETNVARPMRYRADGGALVIRNGREFFNRPLYGPNIPFRVDGGDLPEFSLYLPGHGGNLRLGFVTAAGEGKWLHEAFEVISRYDCGRLLYEVRDPLLGAGAVRVQTLVDGVTLIAEASGDALPGGLRLTWAFAGVSGRKGKRNGDIGCEVEPVSRFFQVRPEECKGNRWSLQSGEAEVVSGAMRLRVTAPEGAELRVVDGARWDAGWSALWSSAAGELPALAGSAPLGGAVLEMRVQVLAGAVFPTKHTAGTLSARTKALQEVATAVSWQTPDAYLDGVGPALGIAADAIWDEAQGCVMHGAVAWRMALAGWRGPYAMDIMGRHDRMQRHLRHWMARQNVTSVTNGSGGTASATGFAGIAEAEGVPDKGSQNARTENLLHSNGDLSHNHYDMNLVCFDALLRHLRWTGDAEFAREAWPALERHAAWERRLFRREFRSDGKRLPLYEAYAAIWASDNLQYNGGGAAHSSAYNVFLNREMAKLARLLGKEAAVAQAYDAEADAVTQAMNALLWMPERGAFAEGRDWMKPRTLSESPAVWTMYHTVDCELVSRKQAWQMAAERLTALRKVPVKGEGVPNPGLSGETQAWQLPCSDWMPYVWSLTLLTTGECLHTALALFQAGMAEEAHGLLRGTLLDAAYRGLCPGNFPMSLQLDPHRQESQRDFADPIGCASRALVQGLWGVEPDLMAGKLKLRPQLPEAWERAELKHPELRMRYAREGKRETSRETWTITHAFAKAPELTLQLRARTVKLPRVKVNGSAASVRFDEDAVGGPAIVIRVAPASAWTVELHWRGEAPARAPEKPISCAVGQTIRWPPGVRAESIDDPQGCVAHGVAARAGQHAVFARMEHGDCRYWLPIALHVLDAKKKFARIVPQAGEQFEPVRIEGITNGQVREIFTRSHAEPRSGLCSLNLPDGLLGGWANFDATAEISDAGLRGAGGMLAVMSGLSFLTPANATVPNCCFLSHWAEDPQSVSVPMKGRARAVYLLLACTTFPQATRSLHGRVRMRYRTGDATEAELRSPANWWPVEQDYLIDDYVFRMEPEGEPETPLPVRVDLATGKVRVLERASLRGKGGMIPGGSATLLRVELDDTRELAALELSCELYGVQMGVLGVTLGR